MIAEGIKGIKGVHLEEGRGLCCDKFWLSSGPKATMPRKVTNVRTEEKDTRRLHELGVVSL